MNAVKEASEGLLLQNGLKFLDKALQFGTTTIEIKSGYGLDFETELKMLNVINRLEDLFPDQEKQLAVLRGNLAWKTAVTPVG